MSSILFRPKAQDPVACAQCGTSFYTFTNGPATCSGCGRPRA